MFFHHNNVVTEIVFLKMLNFCNFLREIPLFQNDENEKKIVLFKAEIFKTPQFH